MGIGFEEEGGATIAAVDGRMDSGTAPDLDRELKARIESGAANVVLDLSAVEYISSAGVRTLIVAARTCKAKNGRLVICGLNSYPEEVLRLAGLLPMFTVRKNRAEALQAF